MVRQIAYAHHKYTLILLLIGRDYTLNTLKSLRNRTLITPSYLSISHNSLLPLSFGATYCLSPCSLLTYHAEHFTKPQKQHTLSQFTIAHTQRTAATISLNMLDIHTPLGHMMGSQCILAVD